VPTFTVLASADTLTVTADGWASWDISSANVLVRPGQVVAWDVLDGSGIGRSPGGYPRGELFFVNAPTFPTFTDGKDTDLFFLRFLVLVAPEPLAFYSWVWDSAPWHSSRVGKERADPFKGQA
jgi:hypothetical protein